MKLSFMLLPALLGHAQATPYLSDSCATLAPQECVEANQDTLLASAEEWGMYGAADGWVLKGSGYGGVLVYEPDTGVGDYVCGESCSGMSGDPIVRIKGKLVKFDMPVKERSLMWKDSMFEIFAEAEVYTPDMSSQWLSQIIVVSKGKDILKIKRREITPTSTTDANALNTLSVTTSNDAQAERKITSPGVYTAGQHKTDDLRITVALAGEKIGPFAKEVVSVKTASLQFSVNAEIAKKFRRQEKKAFKYSHLDIQFQSMGGNVQSGIFAELYGLVPMTAKTAKLIRSLKYEQ